MSCSGGCSTRSPASPAASPTSSSATIGYGCHGRGAQELAAITDRFNALAQALDAARSENEKLNHRLITAQDDERRRTALELHDEVGPSLFGLKANAGSIATAAAELPEQVARKMTARVRDMLAIIEHLQSINRSMLNRLRPMALGHVPLHDILAELVRERARQLPEIEFAFSADKLDAQLRRFGRSHGLSLRAGKPDQRHPPRAGKACRRGARRSGKRRETATANGSLRSPCATTAAASIPRRRRVSALRGMQERVQGLGGRYKVETASGRGTCDTHRDPAARRGRA